MGRYAQLVVGPAGSGKARLRAALSAPSPSDLAVVLGSRRTVSSCTPTAKAWAAPFTSSTLTQQLSTLSSHSPATCVNSSLWRCAPCLCMQRAAPALCLSLD